MYAQQKKQFECIEQRRHKITFFSVQQATSEYFIVNMRNFAIVIVQLLDKWLLYGSPRWNTEIELLGERQAGGNCWEALTICFKASIQRQLRKGDQCFISK